MVVATAKKEWNLFRFTLKECLLGKHQNFQLRLNKIFFDARALALQEKSSYQVDRDDYGLICFLSQHQTTYLKSTSRPDKRFYRKLALWLQDTKTVVAFDTTDIKHFY